MNKLQSDIAEILNKRYKLVRGSIIMFGIELISEDLANYFEETDILKLTNSKQKFNRKKFLKKIGVEL